MQGTHFYSITTSALLILLALKRLIETKIISDEETLPEQKFIVSYEQNLLFVGQETFLKDLQVLFLTFAPHKYNHRVAVFSLRGIGKTQSILEYAYSHCTNYE